MASSLQAGGDPVNDKTPDSIQHEESAVCFGRGGPFVAKRV